MEAEESDVRKSRGRRSRNNSSNSKDSKPDAVRETNGSEGKQSKVSNLPNGDGEIMRSKDSSGDQGTEEKENLTAIKANPNSSSESEVEKDCVPNSEATNGNDDVESTVKLKVISASDSEDDFKGFQSGEEDQNLGLPVMKSLIAKFESEEVISEDELEDEDREFLRHQGYSSDAYWSATNSPHKMDGLNDTAVTDDVCSSNASSPSVSSGFSGDAKPRGKKSHHVDLSNPAYFKPFAMGWKRELVYRNMSDTSLKRMADVYYYTPSGKKVRSARELGEHLVGTELSEENFTFTKMPLGLNDSSKEVIRDAKRGPTRDSSGTPPHKLAKMARPPKLDGTPKIAVLAKDDIGVSPKPTKNFSRGVFPRIRVTPGKGVQQPSPNRAKTQGRPKKDSLPLMEGELEIGMLPPSWKEPTAVSNARKTSPAASAQRRPSPQPAANAWATANNDQSLVLRFPLVCLERCDYQRHLMRNVNSSNHVNKKFNERSHVWKRKKSPSASSNAGGQKKQSRDSAEQQPCSIRCLSMMGVIPSLQCRLCLCLYHPECVGLGTLTDTIHSYVCKKCQQELKEGSVATFTSKLIDIKPSGAPPPPLTPISSMGSNGGGGSGAEGTSLPKLQRLPRPADSSSGPASSPGGSPSSQQPALPPPPPPPPSDSALSSAKLYTVPRYVKVARSREAAAGALPKSIVGAVTTWLPASSTIQLGNAGTSPRRVEDSAGADGAGGGAGAAAAPAGSEDAAGPASPPTASVQAIAHVAGKKYIVVPKHNVLSVSSAAPSAKVADPAPAGDAAARPATGDAAAADADARPPPPYQQSGLLLVPVQPPQLPAPEVAPAGTGGEQPQYVIVNAQTGGLVFNPFARPREDGFVGMTVPSDNHYMQFFMQNLSIGYTALHHVFQFLKVHELLRAARVCRMWHDLAGHPSLWKTVRMKNSQVLDWDGCADMLSRHGTQHLDLRKMILDSSKSQEVWNQFCSAIGRISSLRHLDLCRCPASVVERVSQQCPQLTNLIALFVIDSNLDLKSLKSLSNLQEFRIRGMSGLKLKAPMDVISKLTTLRHLSLTSVKDMGKSGPESLKTLTQLESLELGECSDFSEAFGTECLPCLTKLTRLRLELGQGSCPTFTILTAGVHSLPQLTHLEMVNFDIKPGFDQALAQCTNIRRLLLIPTYLTQSATTNHMVLGGVTKLADSLVQFVWGVTHELLHVTELFVDQCEGQKGGAPKGAAAGSTGTGGGTGNALQQPSAGKKTTGDSIPILLPVPGRDGLSAAGENQPEESDAKPSPQVDILPLSQLQKVLATNLPNTKISILKIPFNVTWRQTLGESSH